YYKRGPETAIDRTTAFIDELDGCMLCVQVMVSCPTNDSVRERARLQYLAPAENAAPTLRPFPRSRVQARLGFDRAIPRQAHAGYGGPNETCRQHGRRSRPSRDQEPDRTTRPDPSIHRAQ